MYSYCLTSTCILIFKQDNLKCSIFYIITHEMKPFYFVNTHIICMGILINKSPNSALGIKEVIAFEKFLFLKEINGK